MVLAEILYHFFQVDKIEQRSSFCPGLQTQDHGKRDKACCNMNQLDLMLSKLHVPGEVVQDTK